MLNAMAIRQLSPRFVDRERELAVLDEARRRAVSGEPAVVVVGGEAGVGKSRLIDEFVEHSRADGARVLVGGCVERHPPPRVSSACLSCMPVLAALLAYA